MKQDVEKDTTSTSNKENGGLRANEVNQSCPGLVPRESPVEDGAPELSALHMHEQEASLSFLALSHLPHTQGSQWPGVCVEGEWEKKRQVCLASQGLCHPLFLSSFLGALPQPEAGTSESPFPFLSSIYYATLLTQVSFPKPAPFPFNNKVQSWRKDLSTPEI